MTKPRVLISDALSDAALRIFEERGVHVDFKPGIGKDDLVKVIPDYDGLAIRSATKVTAKLLDVATRLKVIGRAGIGVDNVDIAAATSKGVIVMNTPFGNSITTAEHAIALMFALARQIRRRSPAARRHHQPAYADDGPDEEHSVAGKPRQNQKGGAHHQLRARRASRREGFAGSARRRPCRRCRDRCLRRGTG